MSRRPSAYHHHLSAKPQGERSSRRMCFSVHLFHPSSERKSLERNEAAVARYRAGNAEAEATGTHAAAVSAAEADGGVIVGAHGVCVG